ncbi:MAG: GAF domain-containing protein [Chloroflexi bacterium]|nr:GAF domain-containing protein [Chloroflexota bacterium]
MTEPGGPRDEAELDSTPIEIEFAPLLAQIGRIMTSSEDIDEVYDRFTEAVTSVIPADRLSIVVVDSDAWQHKARYYAGMDVPLATLDVWRPLGGQVIETVVQSQQPQIVDESNVAAVLEQSPRLQDGIAAGLRTWMDVPVILEQVVVAVMRFMSRTLNAYDARDQELAVLIAAQIAGAVANAQSIESLLATQAELARSNAELEQFAYVASHDLQEPLRMVASYVGLLERRYRGKLDEDADDFIEFAVDGARRMQALLNGLLDLSRVGTRGRELEATESDAALRDALINLEQAIADAGAEVSHEPLPAVLGDRMQLTQLFQNLVSNAVKFNTSGRPRVAVTATRAGALWEFAVADNGIGIDPAHFDRIFQVFQRLHTRDVYEGTGIGLSVCRKIVERHGGTIQPESAKGQGTTFRFTLRAVEAVSGAN